MMPNLFELPPPTADHDGAEPHVLIVAKDARARYAIAGHLLDAGFRVTTAGTYGVVELLLESTGDFDLLVAAQSETEMTQFGMPQLARSVQPELPILLLDFACVGGAGVVGAARHTIDRWPLKERVTRPLN